MFVAHYREDDLVKQSVREHLLESRALAEIYGCKLNIQYVAGLAALLHDLGKYSDDFQTYLYQAVFQKENHTFKRGEVDHATAGGKLLYEMYYQKENAPHEKLLVEIVGNAIISHHGNLHDFITPKHDSDFLRRITKETVPQFTYVVERFFQDVMSKEEFEIYVSEAVKEIKQLGQLDGKLSFYLSKFIFSCVLDADRTNTRDFEAGITSSVPTGNSAKFEKYYHVLIDYLKTLKEKPEASQPINVLRTEMSEQCDRYAEKSSGVYTLSIPTGGGKTLASLRYALKHAKEKAKDRIIYIVPYTTIIEQNAQEVREKLGAAEDLLEHHSNIIDDHVWDKKDVGDEFEEGSHTKKQKLKLTKDDFSAPIIFTTMVQFLNIFYAKGNRNTRRLHNLSNAVIIFDEVQKVPLNCISLFNEAVNFLSQRAKSSILLCTATQPALDSVQYRLIKEADSEIINNLAEVEKAFKRVNIVDRTKPKMNNQDLANWLQAELGQWGNALVILNTKRAVKELYETLKGHEMDVFHLSTSMCAAHRKDQLNEIKMRLKSSEPFICVTTALIEAGVDISFKCVVRSLAGLDSIAQAAGRCNRHGEEDVRDVYVIDHSEESLGYLKEIEAGKDAAQKIIKLFNKKTNKYNGNLLSHQIMEYFFNVFYNDRQSQVSYPFKVGNVVKKMTTILLDDTHEEYLEAYEAKHDKPYFLKATSSMKTGAENFRVIDDITTPIIVPYGDEGKNIIAELEGNKRIEDLSELLKQSQQYTVNVYQYELTKLEDAGALSYHFEGAVLVLLERWYDELYGIDSGGEATMSFLGI
ncbi:CRISPR-associated helicase/endonuclease Cas3 [Bacillus sp. Marseille-P3800]|uniref:CRISPR-associated helicase/endonuclease Cas3 n=1 Tax=Bacillus sp. Marseille-P3800 TaxID=2014782 RepID=UPI000C07ABAB|nr:CRISPR-associated helicase/endonuclease Cas3 [Bacillus sp. Marseille-P3800]